MQLSKEEKQKTKRIGYVELAVVFLLLIAFLWNFQVLVLVGFLIASFVVLLADRENSIYCFAFLTSFAGIFVYQGRHMFFVLAALFIVKYLLYNKINLWTLLFYLLITSYCLLFCDTNGDFSLAKIIGIVLLFTIPVLADSARYIDCRKFMQHYILGFTISTIIGFFVKEIPAMANLFEYDLMWTENYIELTRFSGLAYDSNFYALSNYIILAYLLFTFDKLSRFRASLVVFLIIAGFQTVSKSYYLVLSALLLCYFIKNIANIKKVLLAILAIVLGGGLLVFISDKMGYNVVELVLDRFVTDGAYADITTGRTDIWKDYAEIFYDANIKEFLFGFGFNATVVHAAHNTFIEFFYHYGVFGCLIWGAYFIYCQRLFSNNTKTFGNKSVMVLLCLLVGIFFLSAYTYEAFAMGVAISFMTLQNPLKGRRDIENV